MGGGGGGTFRGVRWGGGTSLGERSTLGGGGWLWLGQVGAGGSGLLT